MINRTLYERNTCLKRNIQEKRIVSNYRTAILTTRLSTLSYNRTGQERHHKHTHLTSLSIRVPFMGESRPRILTSIPNSTSESDLISCRLQQSRTRGSDQVLRNAGPDATEKSKRKPTDSSANVGEFRERRGCQGCQGCQGPE